MQNVLRLLPPLLSTVAREVKSHLQSCHLWTSQLHLHPFLFPWERWLTTVASWWVLVALQPRLWFMTSPTHLHPVSSVFGEGCQQQLHHGELCVVCCTTHQQRLGFTTSQLHMHPSYSAWEGVLTTVTSWWVMFCVLYLQLRLGFTTSQLPLYPFHCAWKGLLGVLTTVTSWWVVFCVMYLQLRLGFTTSQLHLYPFHCAWKGLLTKAALWQAVFCADCSQLAAHVCTHSSVLVGLLTTVTWWVVCCTSLQARFIFRMIHPDVQLFLCLWGRVRMTVTSPWDMHCTTLLLQVRLLLDSGEVDCIKNIL